MKKMYILALAALAMAFSCQKTENSPEPASEPVVRTFTCTIAEPDTKLAIDDATGKTTWEVGDKILIHGEYTKEEWCTTITLGSENISADGKTATFTIGDITTYVRSGYNSNLYAQYPADAVVANNHCYWNNRFNKSNAPLMVGYNKGDSFVMYNLCGILSFVVSGEDFDSFTLTGNNDETVAYSALQSRIRLKDDNTENLDGFPIRALGDDYTSDPLKTLSADFVDGENRIFIPGGVNFTGGFTIKFIKSGAIVKTLSTTSSVSVPRNSYRPMGNVTAYLKTYVPPASHDSSIDMTGATALDGSGNANCYVVDGSVAANAEKVFTFKAYKGNSTTGVGTIASAEILWETWNNAESVTAKSVIAAVDFDKQEANDYYTMVFKMPATLHAGNALIAAKDASGNILWSWHIWIPATEIAIVDEPNYSDKKTMSRNLGALVDTPADGAVVESFGLLYEWGRKDPFPGLGVAKDAGAATVAGTAITFQSESMTIEESIKHPTVYVNVSGKAWTPEATAITDDGVLWGETIKTVYDPCPVGYMLPQRAGISFWKGDQMTEKTDIFTHDAEKGVFTLGSLVFPLAGYIDDGADGHKKAGLRTILWSGRWDSGTHGGYGVYGYEDDGASYKRTSIKRSRGGSVRCVAE